MSNSELMSGRLLVGCHRGQTRALCMPALDMVDTLFLQLAAAPVEAKVQANNCSTVLTVRASTTQM